MFRKSLPLLTKDQKHALHDAGISPYLLSDWKHERRLPTEPQLAIYAAIAGLDRHELQDEIALLRATPEQRATLQRVMGKVLASARSKSGQALGALALIACTAFGIAPRAAQAGAESATMYIMST